MMRIATKGRTIFFGFGAITALLITGLAYHQVDNTVTEEDRQYIPIYLANIPPLTKDRSFQEELAFIGRVQTSVLAIAPRNVGLPFNQNREPKDVYIAKTGLCFDRSRVIEKILRFSGLETRHVAIYSTTQIRSPLRSIFTPGVSSHAVSEVLTRRGWMVVDSNDAWISIGAHGNPKSIEQIKFSVENGTDIPWNERPPTRIYQEPFTLVYGLYSRHGKFYPPYNFVPDVNYGELVQNVL